MMKQLSGGLLALSCGLLLGVGQPATVHAATSAAATASSTTTAKTTTTDSNKASSTNATSSSQSQPVTYRQVTGLKKVSYYTKINANRKHNYKVYKSGGAKSSAANMTAISTGRQFANRKVHITREEKMADGTWLKFTYNHTQTGWIHRNGTVKSYRWLSVPLIAQRPQLPTGCEVTATAMMLKFAGANVSKMSLAKEMPRSSNPNKGFVGNPYSKSGWWIYPKGLMPIVKKHMGSAKNMTGASFNKMKAQINKGHPVVIWVAGVDGFVNHAITLSGYSSTRAYYNDPWTKKKTSMTLTNLHNHRKHDAYRALSY